MMTSDARRSNRSEKRKLEDPSSLVRRFAARIAEASGSLPILDVACGSGRNALALSQLGCSVICIDRDLTRLQKQLSVAHSLFGTSSLRITPHLLDLANDPWPFGAASVGGIINVHFFLPSLVPAFESSLSPGAYLLLETIPGCGGNYLELPKTGVLKTSFEKSFDLEFYKEGRVGPADHDAVTVQLIARRR
jgi:SAM-dependent methyltransferase